MPASVGRAQTWPAHRIAMSRKDPTFGFRESSTQFVSFQVGVKRLYIVYTYTLYIYNLYIYIYIHNMDVFISLLVIPKPLLFGWEWWRSAGT